MRQYGRRRYQRTNTPTISFVELGRMIAGHRLPHEDMKRIWRCMCAQGGAVDSYTMAQFITHLLIVRDELFASGETAHWKSIVQRALEHAVPSNFEFVEVL